MEFKICRVCLDRSATISVFESKDDVQYCEKIMKCANVFITEGDGFPDSICDGCANDLAISFEFTQRCQASDKALRCLDLLQTEELEPETKQEAVESDDCDVSIKLKHTLIDNGDVLDQDIGTPLSGSFSNDEGMLQSKTELIETLSKDTLPLSNQKADDINDICCKNQKEKKKMKKSKKKKANSKVLPEYLRTRKVRLETGSVPCKLCPRVLPSSSAYVTHMRTHTKEKPFTCDICKKSFSIKYSLKKHIMRHYGRTLVRENRSITTTDKRKNRVRGNPIQCETCGKLVANTSSMEMHMRVHTGEKPFACEVCGDKFKAKGTLKRHMVCSHPDKYAKKMFICDYCGKSFYAKPSILIHLRIHTGDKPYLCPFCPQRFTQCSSLMRHKRRHTGEQPYKCEICGRSFIDKSLLKKHQKTVHTDERNFHCHICKKAFKSSISLKAHANIHSRSKLWICSSCGMSFTYKGNLKTHIRRMHSEKSGTCEICKKEFGDLEGHMPVHTGEKPFKCKECGQGYASARSLSYHVGFKHSHADKFRCVFDRCARTFPKTSMLEYHVLKHHSNTSPYVCKHCARGFLRASDLSRHLKCHHMDTQTVVKSHYLDAFKSEADVAT